MLNPLKYGLMLTAIIAVLLIFERVIPITASNTIDPVTLPIPGALLTAACTGLTHITDPYATDQRECGFWLIDPRTQQITKIAQLEAGDEHNETLVWLADGKGFLFSRAAIANVTYFHYPFAYFDGHEFSVISDDIGDGAAVSPDENYFLDEDCRTANMNPGSRYALYSAQTGRLVCEVLTGEASMTGCPGRIYSPPTCAAPLSDGSTWMLAAHPGNNGMDAQICQPDGTCAPQTLYPPQFRFYTPARFASFTLANRIVLFDSQTAQMQIYTLPANYWIVANSWSPP